MDSPHHQSTEDINSVLQNRPTETRVRAYQMSSTVLTADDDVEENEQARNCLCNLQDASNRTQKIGLDDIACTL